MVFLKILMFVSVVATFVSYLFAIISAIKIHDNLKK